MEANDGWQATFRRAPLEQTGLGRGVRAGGAVDPRDSVSFTISSMLLFSISQVLSSEGVAAGRQAMEEEG